jgi:hypothetical protein
MLISDSHQFIFLRMRKVASTSMREILEPYCLPRPKGRIAHLKSRARLESNYQKYLFRAHETIRTARRLMPTERFDQYFKFAFVRNPWERLVSEYEFLLSRPNHGRHQRVKKMAQFSEFIQMQKNRKDAHQLNMLIDSKGQMLTDFIGKMENLDQDWNSICERIGISYQPLPHKKVNQRRAYQSYYDSDTIRLVATHWAREIDYFEYWYEK